VQVHRPLFWIIYVPLTIAEQNNDMLFQMNLDEASGLDGFNLALYKRMWDILVMKILQTRVILEQGVFSLQVIETIVLIPKKINPYKGFSSDFVVQCSL
jgi:hypothetical protein